MKKKNLLVLTASLCLSLNPATVPEAKAWLIPLAKALLLGSVGVGKGKKPPGKFIKGVAAASTATTAISLMGMVTNTYAAPPDPETLTEVEKEMQEAIDKGKVHLFEFTCNDTPYEEQTGEHPKATLGRCILPDGSLTNPVAAPAVYITRLCEHPSGKTKYPVPSWTKRCPNGKSYEYGKSITIDGKILSSASDYNNDSEILAAYHKSVSYASD